MSLKKVSAKHRANKKKKDYYDRVEEGNDKKKTHERGVCVVDLTSQ